MSNENKNGADIPDYPGMIRSEEEWAKYCAELEAEYPRELSPEEKEQLRDLEWAESDPEVQRLYEDKIVAVYQRKVVAVGDDYKTVGEEAERVTGKPRNLIGILGIPGTRAFFGCH